MGALTVELRANTAAFEADMGKARSSLGKAASVFKSTEDTAVKFASKGLAAVTGGGFAVERGIEKMIDTTLKGAGALRLLGETAFVVGGVLAVAGAVQKLKEVIGEKFFGLESDDQALARMKAEIEEQRKFIGEKRAAAGQEIALRQAITKAQFEASAAVKQAIGDEAGARFDALQSELAGIEAVRAADLRAALEKTSDHAARATLETLISQKAVNDRLAANLRYSADAKKIEDDRSLKQMQTWAKETEALLADLERRRDIRKRIEEEGAAAASRLGIADVLAQFKQIEELKRDAENVAQGFAAMVDKGVPLRDLLPAITNTSAQFADKVEELREELQASPAAADALNRALAGLQWGDFVALTEQARVGLVDLKVDMNTLDTDTANLAARIGTDMPRGIQQAIPAIDTLIGRFQLLKAWVDAANASVQNFEVQVAT